METLVAFDPAWGLRSKSGVAVFRDSVLQSAAAVPSATHHDVAMRCHLTAVRARQACPRSVDVFVWEWPQIYRATKGKGDPNDLVGLAAVGSALAALLHPDEILVAAPAQIWGQLPKGLKRGNNPRANRVLSRLSDAEISVIPKTATHDVYDAIGIGLHFLGRLQRVRVFPGAL